MIRCERATLIGAALFFTLVVPLTNGQEGPQPSSAMYDPDLHLFVDNSEIERVWQMARALGLPERVPQPLIVADKPWEIGSNRLILNYGGFGSTIYDPAYKRFRMWYSALNGQPDPEFPEFMCYAESEDGIHWKKPSLGLIDFKGSRDNNIVYETVVTPSMPYFRFTVMRDEVENDPAKRYKGIGWHRPGFFALLTSPDGLHWSAMKDVSSVGGDTMTITWDPVRKLYIMVGRGIVPTKDEERAGGPVRSIGIYESPTMDRWRYEGLAMQLDQRDGFGHAAQHWTMNPFVYGNQYLGILNVAIMRETGPEKRPMLSTSPDGRYWQNRLELVSSHDGREWDYVSRYQAFFAPSPSGYWDGTLLCLASGPPIPVGDYVYFSYTARVEANTIGMAKLRRDRFAGLRAGDGQVLAGDPHAAPGQTIEPVWKNYHPPYVLTKLVKVTGPKLQVNLNTSSGGLLRVSVRQPSVNDKTWGKDPIPGFTSEECVPLSGDGTRLEVHWKNHQDLRELVGREVALMFELKDGTIWSYRFGK